MIRIISHISYNRATLVEPLLYSRPILFFLILIFSCHSTYCMSTTPNCLLHHFQILLPFVPHCLIVASTSAAMAYPQVVKLWRVVPYYHLRLRTSGSIWSTERSICWPLMAENLTGTISGATVDLIIPLLLSYPLMWRPLLIRLSTAMTAWHLVGE